MVGFVKKVVVDRGFGFITPEGPGEDVFFHFSELVAGLQFNEQLIGRRVEFDIGQRDGKQRALRVRPAP